MNILETITGELSTDLLIIAVVFVLFLVYAVRWGKSNSISLLLSLYVGMLIFVTFPYLDSATSFTSSETQVVLSHIGVFLIGVFIAHYILRRLVYAEYPSRKLMRLFQAIILSAGSTALVFAFAYHTFPISVLYDFAPAIDELFTSQLFFWWLVAPFAGLALISRA